VHINVVVVDDLLGRLNLSDPQPKDWKRNFRCALNSLKDVKLMRNMSKKIGPDAFLVYRFLPELPKKQGIHAVRILNTFIRQKAEADRQADRQTNEQ